jgi:hypothetical protein
MFLFPKPQFQEICSKFLYAAFRNSGAGQYDELPPSAAAAFPQRTISGA